MTEFAVRIAKLRRSCAGAPRTALCDLAANNESGEGRVMRCPLVNTEASPRLQALRFPDESWGNDWADRQRPDERCESPPGLPDW